MNNITNLLPSNELPPLDFSSHRAFKSSLYHYVYTRVCNEAAEGLFYHLNTDDVTPIQVLDPPSGDDENPLKRHIMYARPKGKGAGEWYMYDGAVWRSDDHNLAHDAVSVILKAIDNAYDYMLQNKKIAIPTQDSDDKDDPFKKFLKKVEDHKKVLGNLKPLETATNYMLKYLDKAGDPFTEMKYIILRDNRVMDIEKSIKNNSPVFVTSRPEDYIHEMYRVDAVYTPGATPGKALTHYLQTSFQDYDTGVNMCLAFACGLFSPRSSKSYSIIDMYGKPNTGKSTFLESVVSKIAPGLVAVGDATQFGRTADKFALKDLRGKRVVILAEFDKNFSTGTVKRVTGQDPIRYEEKYGAAGSFVFQGVIAVTSNYRTGAKIDITEEGIPERMFPVYFPHSFKNGVGFGDEGVTKWEGEDLRYVALPAENDNTFSWMIDIWLEQEQNLDPDIQKTPAQWEEMKFRTGEADLFAQFLSDMESNAGWTNSADYKYSECVRASVAQSKYAAWLQDHGYSSKAAPEDFKELKNNGKVAKKGGQMILLGWKENTHAIRNSIISDDRGF